MAHQKVDGVDYWKEYNDLFWYVHKRAKLGDRLLKAMRRKWNGQVPVEVMQDLDNLSRMTGECFFKLDDVLQNKGKDIPHA